jgi:surfeit locus 1 family protein
MHTKGLLGLTAVTLVGLAILIGLGVWQLHRLEWKEGLIAQIEARSVGEPISLKAAIAFASDGHDPSYTRVRVEGRFQHDKELHLYAQALNGEPGWHVVTPFNTVDGDLLLVDRGFVPENLKDPSSRAQGQVEGVVAVTGLVRLPESQGPFTPDNEPQANRWFWRDLPGMMYSLYPTATMQELPFYLEAEKSDVPGGYPQGGQTRLELANNHLQYAITWFLLAACLVVVYAVYVRGVFAGKRG